MPKARWSLASMLFGVEGIEVLRNFGLGSCGGRKQRISFLSWRIRELARETFGSTVSKVRDSRCQWSSDRRRQRSQRGLRNVEGSFGRRRHSQFGAGGDVGPGIGGAESVGSETPAAFGSVGLMIGRRMCRGSRGVRRRALRAGDANGQRSDEPMVSGPEMLEVFGPKVLKVGDRRPGRLAVGGIRAFASAREVDGARGTSFEASRARNVKGLRIGDMEGVWG